jgi:hypothetical protein
VWALPRGLLHLLFLHSLCWRVSEASSGLKGRNPALVTLATVYIASWMGDLYVHNRVSSAWGEGAEFPVALLFLALRTVLVVVVQGEMNRVLEVVAPDHDRNTSIGPGLGVVLVLTLGLWGLILLASVA